MDVEGDRNCLHGPSDNLCCDTVKSDVEKWTEIFYMVLQTRTNNESPYIHKSGSTFFPCKIGFMCEIVEL